MAIGTIVEQTRLRREAFHAGATVPSTDHIPAGIHADEASHVEVDLEGGEHFHISAVFCGGEFDGVEEDADGQFVAENGLWTITAVF